MIFDVTYMTFDVTYMMFGVCFRWLNTRKNNVEHKLIF